MSQIFFEELGLATALVNLHAHGGGHGEMTGRMLAALERIIDQSDPISFWCPATRHRRSQAR
jgi:UDP-GlcNAc3NAcA epimerase